MFNLTKSSPKRTYPIKALVLKGNYQSRKYKPCNAVNTDQRQAVGYAKYFLKEVEENGLKILNVTIGISFCPPDYYDEINAHDGKQQAFLYATEEAPCQEVNISFARNDTFWLQDCAITGTIDHDTVMKYIDTRILHASITNFVWGKLYDRVNIGLRFGMKISNFNKIQMHASDYKCFYHLGVVTLQVADGLKHVLVNNLEKNYPDEFREHISILTRPVNSPNHMAINAVHNGCGYSKLKDGCKIIPIWCNVQYIGKNHPFKGHPASINAKCGFQVMTRIGYVALKCDGTDFYAGVSYCNPEDFRSFKSKYGRRLAYKKMMENVNTGKKNEFPHMFKVNKSKYYLFDKEKEEILIYYNPILRAVESIVFEINDPKWGLSSDMIVNIRKSLPTTWCSGTNTFPNINWDEDDYEEELEGDDE